MTGIIYYLSFCGWLVSLSISVCVRISFLFKAKHFSTVCIDHTFFYSSIDGHLGCFLLWLVWIILLWILVDKYLFKPLLLNFFGNIPGSGIAGSYDNSVVNFLRKSLTVSQSSCTALHVYRGSSFSTSLLTSVIFFPPFLPVFLPPSFLPSFFSPSRKRRRRGGSLL